MTEKKIKKLIEITNTPRSKKIATEEPEKCIVTDDENILSLKLDVSSDDCLYKDLYLKIEDFSEI